MPHQTSPQTDDPIVASYPIYLTAPNPPPPTPKTATDCLATTGRRLIVLQYPAYRSSRTPYNTHNRQKPTALRLKPSTGIVELDVPIDTQHNYDSTQGSAHADALSKSRIGHQGGTHGLSGGFNTGSLVTRNYRGDERIELDSIPTSSEHPDDSVLSTQTLCGKIVKPTPGQPVYMLGSFQDGAMHLSSLDALVQVRPELHHLDAADEMERSGSGLAAFNQARGKGDPSSTSSSSMPPPPPPPTFLHNKPESKPLDIKLKATAGPSSSPFGQTTDPTATKGNNNDLLRSIAQEPFQSYTWIDESTAESRSIAQQSLHLPIDPFPPPRLHSTLSNSSYLDLLSAPRVEHTKRPGDKGLMWKVRGREREKQRRKRNEAVRRERRAAEAANANANAAVTATAAGVGVGMGTTATAAAAGRREDGEMVDGGAGRGIQADRAGKVDEAEGTDEDDEVGDGASDDDSSEDGNV